jgi:hypothetical protein
MVVCQVVLWVVSVKGQVGGRERERKREREKKILKKQLLLPLLHIQGKEKKNNVI